METKKPHYERTRRDQLRIIQLWAIDYIRQLMIRMTLMTGQQIRPKKLRVFKMLTFWFLKTKTYVVTLFGIVSLDDPVRVTLQDLVEKSYSNRENCFVYSLFNGYSHSTPSPKQPNDMGSDITLKQSTKRSRCLLSLWAWMNFFPCVTMATTLISWHWYWIDNSMWQRFVTVFHHTRSYQI